MSYLLAFTAYWLVALRLEPLTGTDATGQVAVGFSAWLFLVVALARADRATRVQVVTLVALATALECVGSLLWGAYVYRLGNLPLFVPAGHGLFYLAALRTAALPVLVQHGRAIAITTTLGASAYMAWGLFRPPLPDLLGFVTWAVFLRFMLRGRYPLLYAVSFLLTTALELYGTSLGVWAWAPVLPGLMLPAGNPPTGIGAGYCAMDGLTRRIVRRLTNANGRDRTVPAIRIQSEVRSANGTGGERSDPRFMYSERRSRES